MLLTSPSSSFMSRQMATVLANICVWLLNNRMLLLLLLFLPFPTMSSCSGSMVAPFCQSKIMSARVAYLNRNLCRLIIEVFPSWCCSCAFELLLLLILILTSTLFLTTYLPCPLDTTVGTCAMHGSDSWLFPDYAPA